MLQVTSGVDERLDQNNFRFLGKNAHVGILRLKRDVGDESSIGLIATTYNFIEKHNHLAGVDGQLRINPKTIFSFQLLGTTSRRFSFLIRSRDKMSIAMEMAWPLL